MSDNQQPDPLPATPRKLSWNERLIFFLTLCFILVVILLSLTIVVGFSNEWITKLLAVIGTLSSAAGLLALPPFKKVLLPSLDLLQSWYRLSAQKLRRWTRLGIKDIQRLIEHMPLVLRRVLLILWIVATTAYSIYNLAIGHPASNIVSACQHGSDTFQVAQYNAQYIGMSDSSCYTFTSENGIQSTIQAENEVYKNNAQIPISAPHITIIVTTMLANADLSSYDVGIAVLQGALIAQSNYNAHLQPGQPPLRLIIANTGANEAYAPQIAQQIVQLTQTDHSIIGVMGWPFSTNSAMTALNTLNKVGIPSVSPTLSSTQFDHISSYFFRIIPTDAYQAAYGAHYLHDQSGIKQVIVGEDSANPYSESLAESFKAVFQSDSNNIITTIRYTRGQLVQAGMPLTNFVNEIEQHIPAGQVRTVAVYFAGYANDFASVNKALSLDPAYTGLTLMGGDGLDEYTAYSNEDAYTRFYFTAFSDLQSGGSLLTSAQNSFITQYQQEAGGGDKLVENDAVLADDATYALLNAYSSLALSPSSPQIWQQMQIKLENLDFAGLSGQITMGGGLYPSSKAVYLEQWSAEKGLTLCHTYGDAPANQAQGSC